MWITFYMLHVQNSYNQARSQKQVWLVIFLKIMWTLGVVIKHSSGAAEKLIASYIVCAQPTFMRA